LALQNDVFEMSWSTLTRNVSQVKLSVAAAFNRTLAAAPEKACVEMSSANTLTNIHLVEFTNTSYPVMRDFSL